MAGKKKCLKCEISVPVAKRVCECGYTFIKQSSYVYKKKKFFQDMPIETSDHSRTTRHVRMKRTTYVDNEYLYNVPDSPKREVSGLLYSNGEQDPLDSLYGQNELNDKVLNDAALGSIDNTITSNNVMSGDDKNKIEKLYPKRQRYKAKYSNFHKTKKNGIGTNGKGTNDDMICVKEEVLSGGSDSENLTLQSDRNLDESDDEKTLKQVLIDISESASSQEEGKPVKKKCGRPRIHPIRPKKPVGRPRKNPPNTAKHQYIFDSPKGKQSNGDAHNEMDKWSPNGNTVRKKGRPKGCKDSKPRKIRHDYLQRLAVVRNVDVEELTKEIQVSKNKCFLSPPSLISSKRKEKHVLNDAEIEKIEKRLNKTNPFIIPETKKELYSTILGEINRRISSQLFQSSLQIDDES